MKRPRGSADPRWIPRGAAGRRCVSVTACTMQRQAKRLRAETEATACSTIAPVFGKPQISAGTGSKLVSRKPAWKRPFLFGVQEPFFFSGKYRKEKWVLICAGYGLHHGTRKTDCHTSDIGHWFAMTCRGGDGAQKSTGVRNLPGMTAPGLVRTFCRKGSAFALPFLLAFSMGLWYTA